MAQYPSVDPVTTIWRRFKRDENGCWIWTGAISDTGYGTYYFDGRFAGAHRAAYEVLVGPIPSGYQLDHLCRVRACINPAHLEPVTPRENTRRGRRCLDFGECANGHVIGGPEDIYVRPDGTGSACRTCIDVRSRQRAKNRAKP